MVLVQASRPLLSCCCGQVCLSYIGRRLWQYATQAVLMDANHSNWPSARALVEWRERRRRYIALYQRKLAALKHSASSSNLQKQVAAEHSWLAHRPTE